jgi:hypothetical protein
MSEKNNNQLQTLSKRINDHLKEIYENKCRVAAIIFILLSLIFFLTMLIGSTNGSVNLNKFTFEGPISKILQRKSITFTLLGYCIDDKCTNEVSHNFDKGKFKYTALIIHSLWNKIKRIFLFFSTNF